MEKENALVAGGAGFIGSWLCEKLVRKGYNVMCVDNLITGSEKNIDHLIKYRNFRFINHDVIKPFRTKDKIDLIFNLASPASPIDYQQFSEETLLVNSIGNLNLLKMATASKASFVFASTSEVYGNSLQHPQREDYWGNVNPTGPRSMYDESKRFGEALCMEYSRRSNVDVRIARIFNTYGPRMQRYDGRVVSNFINQALQNKPLTLYGKGEQTRSFCYVTDLVEGLFSLMFKEDIGGEVVNLGNPIEKTIKEIALIIKKIIGSNSYIINKEMPQDDPERRCPDITKAKKLLGWTPNINLEDGLKKTIEWYKENN